jgi:hypothetical protein
MSHKQNWEEYGQTTGLDKPLKEAVEQHDKTYGTYKDNITPVPTDDRLPTANMPKAPDPSPFALGPMAGGGR